VISAEEIALLEPGGRLRILEMATGDLRADLQVPEGTEHARELRVVRIGRNYAVAGNLDQTSGRRTNRSPFADQFFPCVEIDGWLWLLSPEGQPLWQSTAYVDGYQMPREQPLNVPILVMLRRESGESRANGRRRADTVQLACLDRRDGRLMVGTMQITAHPANHQASIEFYMGNRTLAYTLQWTDQPRPPEPPAQLGQARSRMPGNQAHRALRVVGSMLDALGTQALRIVDPERALDELSEDLEGPLDAELDDVMDDVLNDEPGFEP
jgi:hypothetical protein